MREDLQASGDKPTPCTNLSGVELELEYVKSRGLAYLRCGEHNFAMFNRSTNELTIFGSEIELAASSFHDNQAAEVFRDAQALEATFTTQNGKCKCSIGDVESEGDTYVEAALRALVTFRSQAFIQAK